MALQQVTSLSQDPATTQPGSVATSHAQIVVQDQTLAGDTFEGSTIDETERWTLTEASSGTATQANGAMTLATSTNTAGRALITGDPVLSMFPGSEIRMRASMRLGTIPIADNLRELLIRVDGNNYVGFVIDGASFYARVVANSVSLLNEQINAVQPSDLNFMEVEIRLTKTSVRFLVKSGEGWLQVASFEQRGQQATMMYGGGLSQLYAQSFNSGSSVNNTLILTDIIVTRRLNRWPMQARVKQIAASAIIVRGPCFFLGAYANGAADVVTFYDNVAASGKKVGGIAGAALSDIFVPAPLLPVECYQGLYAAQTTGSDDVYIYYSH
jgi:hypothetical protein